MYKKRVLIFACFVGFALHVFLFVTLLRGYSTSITEINASQGGEPLLELNTMTATVNGETMDITLPYTFTDLDARTEITLTATFSLPMNYSFYIESEYTPLLVYADGVLVYEYGQEGSYPATMFDPAAAGQIVVAELYNTDNEPVELTLVYQSAITRNYFTVEPIYFGLQNDLYEMVFAEMGFAFVFSFALILISVFLAFVTCFIITFETRAFRILLLGLSGVLAGFWLLCDCTLTSLFTATPTQLYLISIYAMAVFPVPLIWFALATLELRNRVFLFVVSAVNLAFVIASACFLHTGLVRSMIRVEQAFNVIVPLSVSLLAAYVLYEYIRYHIVSLQRFALPAVMFALFTILEVTNNRFSFANLPFTFFQAGIMVFMFSMGILAGLFMRDTLALQAESQQAEFNLQMMQYQAGMLKKHSGLMMETADDLRKQRHDLRHQLTAINTLAEQEDLAGLRSYLDSVMQRVPTEQIFYCNNATVNAILSHYAAVCAKAGIALSIDVVMPNHCDIPDIDFCVIFGNLLENAVEACEYVEQGKRRVSIRSFMRYNNLLINMENTFDGYYKRTGGVFRSRKRAANGIGLTSVQSIAEGHGGGTQFKAEDGLFISSIYLSVS